MSSRNYWMTALLVLKLSSSWAQEAQAPVDHSQHFVAPGHRHSDINSGTKPATTVEPTDVDMDTMPGMDHSGMDHSQMNHDAMPGTGPADESDAAHDAGHNMNHSGDTSGQADAMNSMNHADHSMSIQSGLVPSDVRDPHAYAEGYDFGSISRPEMGDEENMGSLLVDRLESVITRDNTSMTYDWQAWYGQTYDRALIRAEGEIEDGSFKDARNELLWAHAITAYWDTQLGLRYDSGKGTDRGWLAFGVQGLAPYWLYVEATAYVNEQGRTAFRLETEYDVLLTQKLIVQPRVEMNFYSRRDDSRDVSSGLSNIEAGLRLRYEIRRELAPYIGFEWASRFGSAADNIRASGDAAGEARLVAGLHFWF